MDNPTITEPREDVPDWAKSPRAGTAAEVAAEALTGAPKITPAQRSYLLDLIEKKQVTLEQEGKVDLIMKCLRISEDPEEYGMSRPKASELIDLFKRQPDKPLPTDNVVSQGYTTYHLISLPAGRYAIENNEGELRFYQKWESRDKKAHRLYVMFGPYEAKLPMRTQEAIATKIMLAGVRECAIRFGLEIGECSNCGRRLTNRISRELGIGPVCGGRMFGDDFRSMASAKRLEIVERGEDPDEEME